MEVDVTNIVYLTFCQNQTCTLGRTDLRTVGQVQIQRAKSAWFQNRVKLFLKDPLVPHIRAPEATKSLG